LLRYTYALTLALYGNAIQRWNEAQAGNIISMFYDNIGHMYAFFVGLFFSLVFINEWNKEGRSRQQLNKELVGQVKNLFRKNFPRICQDLEDREFDLGVETALLYVHMFKRIWKFALVCVFFILILDLPRRFFPVFIVSIFDFGIGITLILCLLGHVHAWDDLTKTGFFTVLSVTLQCAGCSVDIMGSIVVCGFVSKVFAYAASFITNTELSLSRGAFPRRKKFYIIAGTALASFLFCYIHFLWIGGIIFILALLMSISFSDDNFWLYAESVFVRGHQLVKFTCSQYQMVSWLEQFSPHFVAIYSAIGIVIWHRLLYFNHQHSVPSAEIAVLTLAYSAVLYRSLMRETKQFLSSVNEARKKYQFFYRHKNQPRQFSRDNFFREVKCIVKCILTCDYINDFWNWLDLLHVVLGMFAVMLIWIKSPNAMAVMATASFFRWWGCLFYLQATSRLSRRSFFSHVLTVSAGF
jgi:hypothetical protein